jgi:hypothetical protein
MTKRCTACHLPGQVSRCRFLRTVPAQMTSLPRELFTVTRVQNIGLRAATFRPATFRVTVRVLPLGFGFPCLTSFRRRSLATVVDPRSWTYRCRVYAATLFPFGPNLEPSDSVFTGNGPPDRACQLYTKSCSDFKLSV